MITIKNSQLSNETVSSLNNLIDMDINAKIAFRLMRIIKEISSLVEDKLKLEKRVFDKHMEKNADGSPVLVEDEDGQIIPGAVRVKNVDDFNKEMFELMSIENTLPFEKINFDDLNLEKAKIKDLIKLDFLFE